MRRLTYILLIGAALLTQTGCDDVLEDFSLDLGLWGDPGYCWSGPSGGYCEDTYYEEYWYEETYYEDWSYDEGWYLWPW